MPTFFHFDHIQIPFKNRKRLKDFLNNLFEREGYRLERLDYIFCTDSSLLKINKEYLKHDTYTDIITFDISDHPGKISGEIYISGERVLENARKYTVSFEEELHRVIFHGALHLCGYRDKTATEKKQMREKENENLRRYFKS